jgi:hypothetical protein
MPDGATTQNLLNTWGVRDTISKKAKDWYQYARFTRGRYVKNGDIRVVVGIDKVSSWGIATSACSTGQTASYIFKHDPIHTYKWDCIGGSGRVGPQRTEIQDLIENNIVPQNQCVFVRAINFTLSGKSWNDFPSEAVQHLVQQPGSESGRFFSRDSSSNRGRPRGGHGSAGSGGTSSSHTRQACSHDSESVNFDPVELGVSRASLLLLLNPLHLNLIQVIHPSAALHNYLHEKVTKYMHSDKPLPQILFAVSRCRHGYH